MCRGVIANLAGMMGPEMLRERGIMRIVGSGACLIRDAEISLAVSELASHWSEHHSLML